MDVILIVIGCLVLFFILRNIGYKIRSTVNRRRHSAKQDNGKNIPSPELVISNDLKTAEDCNKKIAQLITNNFSQNRWSKWDNLSHEESGQLERLKRATLYGDDIHIVQYNDLLGIAKIQGTSGNYYLTSDQRCSCPDYRKRLKPCKHMYKLAVFLTDEDMHLETDQSIKGLYSHDNIFGGLRFTIIGKGQKAIKEFVVEHSGIYGNFGLNEMSALLIASDVMTEKRVDAITHDVEILTFEQLQNLFDIYVDGDETR